VSNLVDTSEKMLFDESRRAHLIAQFHQLHQSLRLGASDTAAQVLAQLLMEKRLS